MCNLIIRMLKAQHMVSEWYRGNVEVLDSRTLKVTLPDGMKITPGQPVPPEILEMMAAYLRLKNDNVLSDAEGCGVQLGVARVRAEGCGAQLGAARQAAEGCGAQLGAARQAAEGCGAQFGGANTRTGSGTRVTEVRNVSPFSMFDLAAAAAVSITTGEPQHVAIEIDDNLIGLIRTDVSGDQLTISRLADFTSAKGLIVSITVNHLISASLSGSGDLTIENVHEDHFLINVSGSGSVKASGNANRVNLTIGGSGEINAFGLIAASASARVGGQGSIKVFVTENLDASIRGVGQIVFLGTPPSVQKHIEGIGQIEAG
jgi:Putative auto-transporter adhesin, head GIN domain